MLQKKDEEIKQKHEHLAVLRAAARAIINLKKERAEERKTVAERDTIHINKGSRLSDFRLNCFVEF